MMHDAFIVAKKELREILTISLSKGHLFTSAVLIGIFGLFLPYQEGDFFLRQTSASLSLYIFLVPLIICSGLVADSFAGERERKTLESLLSTRLSDGAIFIGKILAVLGYTYLFLLVTLLASILGTNFYLYRSGRNTWFFYNALSCFSLLVFTIPVILFGTGVGIFFSLKCRDLRTAFQFSRMGWFLITLPFVTGWLSFKISWDFLIPAFYILSLLSGVLLYLGVRFFRRFKIIA